jgi:hypothetical protein
MHLRNIKLFLTAFLLIVSCTEKVKYQTTDTGLKYIFHVDKDGKSPRVNNYVTLNMVYKLENDSVPLRFEETGMPMRYQLTRPPFEGALEEGIELMSEGDSATFFVSADSMFEKVFKKPLPDFLKKGSRLVFDIRLLKIQSASEAEAEIREKLTLKFAEERKLIDAYVAEKKITEKPSATGLYVIITEKDKRKITAAGRPACRAIYRQVYRRRSL